MMDTLTGQTIGKYKVTERLGRGGMADVYKAYQENLDRYVAIKVMHPHLVSERDFIHRFQREARAMAALNHPNIAGIYDFDTFGKDSYYLVMEYISGGTLKEMLEDLAARRKRLPLKRSIRIILEVASALVYAHRRGMIHRDIKPGNIMINEAGRAMLTDFGIVKLVGGQSMTFTATGALIGTPAYMSPEQALGKPGDERCDIYSLGILLFQMVTGQLPFEADTPLAVVMKHVNEAVPLPVSFNPNIPPALQTVVLKALLKNPDDRYQSAGEFAAALRAIGSPAGSAAVAIAPPPPPAVVTSAPVKPPPPMRTTTPTDILQPHPPQPAAPPKKKRSLWLWIALVLLFLVISAVAAMTFIPGLLPATKTPIIVSVLEPTNTSTPLPPTETEEPTATTPPAETPDVVASAIAAIEQTRVAGATVTTTPTLTTTPSPTTTTAPDAGETATGAPTTTPTATTTGDSGGGAGSGSGLPLDFETFGAWGRGDEANGTFTQSSAQVHGGSASGKLSYDFGTTGNDYVVFLQNNSISGAPNALQVWVYGDSSANFLNAWIADADGQTWQVPFGQIFHGGWQQMTGYILEDQAWPWTHISGPDNGVVDYPISFRGFVLDDYASSYIGQGAVYLDDLTAATLTVGNLPTAEPSSPTSTPSGAQPTAAPSGTVGQILYTSDNTILSSDPGWSSPVEVGTVASDTCSSPASTVAGQTYNLYYGNYCSIGATGTGVCASPNGQYNVLTNNVGEGNTSIVVRLAGSEENIFVYQGVLDRDEGIRWSPSSDSFLFVTGDIVYRAFPNGSFGSIIPTAFTPIFSPDGSYILYRKPVGPGVNDIFVANSDGTNQRNVTNVSSIDKRCPAWRD